MQAELHEPRQQEFPVVLTVEEVGSGDHLVGVVDCCQLTDVSASHYKGDIAIQSHHLRYSLRQSAVVDDDDLLERVGVEAEERLQRLVQEVHSSAGREYCRHLHTERFVVKQRP